MGTVTWLPPAGTQIERGAVLYKRDNRPVVLFLGDVPLFRPLDAAGIKGPDAKVVNQNLRSLGFARQVRVTFSPGAAWRR